ncbi:MAG: shikimate dehydrogenase [Acidobacteria bacterium]|nr:shikimate dehydrogenase [Acidobacteriota bacterium]
MPPLSAPVDPLLTRKLVCVPITEREPAAFLAALAAAAVSADIIELRLDYLSDAAHAEVFAQLPALVAQYHTPLLFTLRPREQGGQRDLSLGERRACWQSLPAAVAATITLADFEFDLAASFAAEPPPVPWEKVICSWHNFEGTPDDLIQRYERMAATPAAIVKLATKCNCIGDCLRLFEVIEYAQSRKPIIALGMSLPGLSTRVLSLSRGALLTFGALQPGAESAPGQPTVADLNQLYRVKQLTRASQIFGVMGQPIGHSRSPLIHNPALQAAGIDGVYLPLEVDGTAAFIRDFVHPHTRKLGWNLRGLSVTIPHKLAVMPLLDEIDATAQAIGAVNTIVVESDRLRGFNTDVHGAMQPLNELLDVRGARVAVLGAGGSARAVCYGLQQRGAAVTLYARDLRKAQSLAAEFNATAAALDSFHGQADIVINCTPLGMKGHSEGTSPLTAERLRDVRLVYDLVYNPEQTALLQTAQAAGCQTLGGLAMLVAQAAEQFRLWTHQAAPIDVMWQAART